MTSAQLTWSQVIATYNRADILHRALELNARQTRPPSQIIVVDSSDDWEKSRDRVLLELAPQHPQIEWIYVQAENRSSAMQRNQGALLASSDVFFMFDDDSLMYPDCAERIMEIYEADTLGKVAGVNAVHVETPPDGTNDVARDMASAQHSTTKNYGPVAKLVRQTLKADDVFVPYDETFPEQEVPGTLEQLPVGRRTLLVGWGMTFRRAVAQSEPFERILRNYAAGEDSDMSYRASRHGCLLTAREAKLHHVGSRGGRLSPYVVSALGALNPLVLHRIYSTDLERSKKKGTGLLLRRGMIMLAKDLSTRSFGIPNARGYIFAATQLKRIFSMSETELRTWYPKLQTQLIEAHQRKPEKSESP